MKSPFSLRDIVVLPLCAAVMYGLQVALSPLPNIEVVSLLVIIFTLVYRAKALIIIYLFVMCEFLTYGVGIWHLPYLYIWAVLWLVVMLLPKFDSPFMWAVVCGLYGLFFGAMCVLVFVAIGDFGLAVSNFVSGIPFDLLHCVGNFVLTLVLFKPLYKLICRIEKRG